MIGGFFIVFAMDQQGSKTTLCLFKNITGIPCPGCGMSRATMALIHLDAEHYFQNNILALPFLLAGSVVIGGLGLGLWRRDSRFLSWLTRPWPKPVFIVIILIILANWIRNIAIGL